MPRGNTFSDVTKAMGDSPMIQINRLIPEGQATVFAKCEFFNPLNSVKDRIGVAMIEAGEADGSVTPDTHVIEPTSGNTGIALAFGLIILVMVYATGHISGAHFNPAVTVGFATANRFPWKEVPAYVAGQLLAAITAIALLRIMTGSTVLGQTLPSLLQNHMIWGWSLTISHRIRIMNGSIH